MMNQNSTDDFSLEIKKLEEKIAAVDLPPDLRENVVASIERLKRAFRYENYSRSLEEVSRYVDWVSNLPWNKKTEDILDLNFARKVLDGNHYGLALIKERILEYLAVLKLQKDRGGKEKVRAPILCFVGLVGTGKTTLAYSIAQSLGRKFARIPFGGLGDPGFLRGQSRMFPDSEPGQVIKALKSASSKNPVILLDEVDRVVEESRATIMGVLVELLDPEQNERFADNYLDYPFDLSEVLFIATANNTTNISTAVLDRLEPMQMPSYNDEEKTTIGQRYILPRTMKSMGLSVNDLEIASVVWPKIVRPLGFDAGVRTLERNIAAICRKAAKMIVEGQRGKIVVGEENLKEFVQTW
ncbi:MAG TPA: AAA family ATPase [Patescibacteria group bacterium]|nr:AAA family ATPase [Patescibacteria group bacterium]